MNALIHECVNGVRIEYPEPSKKMSRFLAMVSGAFEDRTVNYDTMVGLVFGHLNPLLEVSPLGTPLVTIRAFSDPVFWVMRDMMDRKHLEEMGISPEKISREYTLTVNDAAERLKITSSAVRQLISKRRLPCWVKGGFYHLHPKFVEQYARSKGMLP
jgi:excisionase family DNA binding protein